MYYRKSECDSLIDVREKIRWNEEFVEPLAKNRGEYVQCICVSKVSLELFLIFLQFLVYHA